VNFARALALLWELPIIPVNHLEGHLVASAVDAADNTDHRFTLAELSFPVLGLVLSGGHTEFVRAASWGHYETIGRTRDDSIGEAFDKVARLLGIPYPGGPGLSALAEKGRPALHKRTVPAMKGMRALPRPMLHSGDLDFSFSGIKTAALYQVRDLGELTNEARQWLAADFEESVTEVILAKTTDALTRYPGHTFLLGGGVSANTYMRSRLADLFAKRFPDVTLRLPAAELSTDNAVMIGMTGYLCHLRNEPTRAAGDDSFRARGDLPLER
jgi:N6-L-threonylcarbamoyladenine synthase